MRHDWAHFSRIPFYITFSSEKWSKSTWNIVNEINFWLCAEDVAALEWLFGVSVRGTPVKFSTTETKRTQLSLYNMLLYIYTREMLVGNSTENLPVNL
jgi:hypothetical protein